jgi:hypothetical protein
MRSGSGSTPAGGRDATVVQAPAAVTIGDTAAPEGTPQAASTPAAGGVSFTVAPRALVRALWTVVLVVLAIGIGQIAFAGLFPDTKWAKYSMLVALDAELSLPAWFSAMLMAAAAALCFVASRFAQARDPANRRGWLALSLIFVYLSFDEAASIHERVSWEVQAAFNLRGVFYFAWVLVAAPLIVLLVVLLHRFLLRLPSPVGLRVFLAGVVFVVGALGCEMIASALVERGVGGFWYWTEVIAEEGLEMAGLVLFVAAILDYLARTSPTASITFVPR